MTARHAHAGLTLIEIMLATAVLAVGLGAAVLAYGTLRSSQRAAIEERQAYEIARALSERILGARWGYLGQHVAPSIGILDQTRYAWSWHRRERPRAIDDGGPTPVPVPPRLPPLSDRDYSAAELQAMGFDIGNATVRENIGWNLDIPAPPAPDPDISPPPPDPPPQPPGGVHNLVRLGVLDRITGLDRLRVYVEYYHASALDEMFRSSTADPRSTWKQLVDGETPGLNIHVLPESPFASTIPGEQMNLDEPAVSLKAIAVRITVSWRDAYEVEQRHELVFARRK